MRRACDWLVDRFLTREVDQEVRAALRLGAYQIVFLQTAPHAAVGATVGAVPRRARGFVNAVLRRVVDAGSPDPWPSDGVRLSYPDWIVDRLVAELGDESGRAALEAMNRPSEVTVRADGYVQDQASQWVAEHTGAQPGERIADLCAAPGGKATLLGSTTWVAASDRREGRVRLLRDNAARLAATRVASIVADGREPPYRPGSFDRVLVDAPCSGLGVLRRRPDARWRLDPADVDRLARLQIELVDAAMELVRPGGLLVYSVCTLTTEETRGIDDHLAARWPEAEPLPVCGAPWDPVGRGARLLPQRAGTDGMYVLRVRTTHEDHPRSRSLNGSAE
jgi:16S rRNA (cytosine967-C5)-methyltransferase